MANARHTVQRSHGALVLGAALLLAGASSGCGTDTCTAGDDACILAHLRVYDKGGNPVALTQVPGSAVNPNTPAGGGGAGAGGGGAGGSSGAGAGSNGAVPSVMGLPGSAIFSDVSPYLEITLQFTDPCGARPAGCFTVHHGSNVGAELMSPWVTTAPVYDQMTTGQWPFQIGFDYTTTATDLFTLDFVPWSSCAPPGQDPIQAFESGSSVAIGGIIPISVTVDAPASGAGGGGAGTGNPCQSGDYCYCWNCNGDEECLLTVANGQPMGCSDEGSDATCGGLLTFAENFWGVEASSSCTQSQ